MKYIWTKKYKHYLFKIKTIWNSFILYRKKKQGERERRKKKERKRRDRKKREKEEKL